MGEISGWEDDHARVEGVFSTAFSGFVQLARLRAELARLRRENERLRKALEAARRAGFRQAAPFLKGAPTDDPRRPGRKPGPTYGRQGRRRVPLAVDDPYDVPVSLTCPDCGGAGEDTHVTARYQEPPARAAAGAPV